MKLKPCHFCGSTELELCRTNPRAYWVRCAKCGADAPSSPRRKKAIEIWNARPESQAKAVFVTDDEAEHRARRKQGEMKRSPV